MNADQGIPIYRDPRGGDAAVFLDWTWSQQARHGRRLFEAWVSERKPTPTLVIFPDDDPAACDWLMREFERTGHGFHGGGHGSLLFVRCGQVIDWIAEVHCTDLAGVLAKGLRPLNSIPFNEKSYVPLNPLVTSAPRCRNAPLMPSKPARSRMPRGSAE